MSSEIAERIANDLTAHLSSPTQKRASMDHIGGYVDKELAETRRIIRDLLYGGNQSIQTEALNLLRQLEPSQRQREHQCSLCARTETGCEPRPSDPSIPYLCSRCAKNLEGGAK